MVQPLWKASCLSPPSVPMESSPVYPVLEVKRPGQKWITLLLSVCVVERKLDMHMSHGCFKQAAKTNALRKAMLITFVLGRRIEPESRG